MDHSNLAHHQTTTARLATDSLPNAGDLQGVQRLVSAEAEMTLLSHQGIISGVDEASRLMPSSPVTGAVGSPRPAVWGGSRTTREGRERPPRCFSGEVDAGV